MLLLCRLPSRRARGGEEELELLRLAALILNLLVCQLLRHLVGKGGLEPPRLSARDPKSRSSTIPTLPLVEPPRTRTWNPLIKSQLLCQIELAAPTESCWKPPWAQVWRVYHGVSIAATRYVGQITPHLLRPLPIWPAPRRCCAKTALQDGPICGLTVSAGR